jgi:hypothetical protein
LVASSKFIAIHHKSPKKITKITKRQEVRDSNPENICVFALFFALLEPNSSPIRAVASLWNAPEIAGASENPHPNTDFRKPRLAPRKKKSLEFKVLFPMIECEYKSTSEP